MVVSSPNRDPNRNENNPQSKEAHSQLQSEGLRLQEALRRLHHRDLGVHQIQSGEVRMCPEVFLAEVVHVRELEGPREERPDGAESRQHDDEPTDAHDKLPTWCE